MAHNSRAYSNEYACIAGAMITSCGWVDALLYTLTRRRLLRDTMPQSSSRREGSSNWDKCLGSQGITHTRTITVEGGQIMDALDGRGKTTEDDTPLPGYERPVSATGSIDPILQGMSKGGIGRTKTEVSVGLQEIIDDERDRDDDITPLPAGWVRHPRDQG